VDAAFGSSSLLSKRSRSARSRRFPDGMVPYCSVRKRVFIVIYIQFDVASVKD
jgi:hypothetical protein